MKILSKAKTMKSPIVIAGGGPVGLLMSLLLSEYQVPSIVIEAQTPSQRFQHPQAHFLNTRTMEILCHCLGGMNSTSKIRHHESVYRRVVAAMPPIQQWDSFRFGSSMLSPPLAVVRHPVYQPLQLNHDANGVLLDHNMNDESYSLTSASDLSPCKVGHLAQHTFGRILYEEALQRPDMISLRFGTTVDHVRFNPQSKRFLVSVTSPADDSLQPSPAALETNICIAADGAHSSLRKQFRIRTQSTRDSTISSDPAVLQHLINIHVEMSKVSAACLHQNDNYAMLYSIFSSTVVAMVVCHSLGDYIIQIPYFPPYQTVEIDFGPSKLAVILQAIFGPQHAKECVIRSVKPWTMKSFVADRYFSGASAEGSSDSHCDAALLLLGDAAHVFPPAGGFGMNTGLQDAHNVAWKIATIYGSNVSGSEVDDSNRNITAKSSAGSRTTESPLWRLLSSYELERKPVAEVNAALSIRNYQRLLNVVESLYLYQQHPKSLQYVLDQSTLLPMSTRQTMFRSLLETALYPLKWLNDPNHIFTQHIRTNLRRVLKQGAGLPLLFPRFEMGFTYCKSNDPRSHEPGHSDTLPLKPCLDLGRLVPHVVVRVLHGANKWTRLQFLDDTETISTVDLPSQMRRDSRPSFVLFWICDGTSASVNLDVLTRVQIIGQMISTRIGLPVELVVLCKSYVPAVTHDATQPLQSNDVLLLSECNERQQSFSFYQSEEQQAVAVLIRPDGHIAGLAGSVIDLDDIHGEQVVCDELIRHVNRFW